MYVYIYVEISPGENFTNFATFYSFMMLIFCPLLMIAQRVRRPKIYSTISIKVSIIQRVLENLYPASTYTAAICFMQSGMV